MIMMMMVKTTTKMKLFISPFFLLLFILNLFFPSEDFILLRRKKRRKECKRRQESELVEKIIKRRTFFFFIFSFRQKVKESTHTKGNDKTRRKEVSPLANFLSTKLFSSKLLQFCGLFSCFFMLFKVFLYFQFEKIACFTIPFTIVGYNNYGRCCYPC